MGADVLTDVKALGVKDGTGKGAGTTWALPGTTDSAGTARGDVGPCLGVLSCPLSPGCRSPSAVAGRHELPIKGYFNQTERLRQPGEGAAGGDGDRTRQRPEEKLIYTGM